uniref:Uncharacterized protein n=1 Tax=viral metagenome TaxID=1070528 RepID=A0A6M3LMC5_9ZZZZ
MSVKCIEKMGVMVFICSWNGSTVKISVPSGTNNEWGAKNVFLDLPFMELEVLDCYISALQEIREFCSS